MEFNKEIVEMYGKIAMKCLELSLTTDFDAYVRSSMGFGIHVTKQPTSEECYSYFSDAIYLFDEETALKQGKQLYQDLCEAVEHGVLKLDWVIDMAEDYVGKNADATPEEVAKEFDLELCDIEHLFPEQEEVTDEVFITSGTEQEQAMKYAGHTLRDFE